MTTIISIILAAVLAILLVDRVLANRKLSESIKLQQETNMELRRRIPVTDAGSAEGPQPLTIEKIADAIRMEGYFPEIEETGVRFKVQGESFYVDAERLPLIFLVKIYSLDPNDWEMDLLRDAAHLMSDALIMVKATIADDDKSMSFFVAAQDRNFESFRANLISYMRILEDGQQKMNEEYHRMADARRDDTLAAQPVVPPARTDTKVMS